MTGPRLAEHTTLRLGGPARDFQVATTESQLIEVVAAADGDGTPLLVLSGGSNLVVSDEGFPGTVVHVRTRGIDSEVDGEAVVTVAAGEDWDGFVAHAVDQGWSGVEALSGIPGSVGATPIQNVGAYGQEVSQTVASVRCWDRLSSSILTLSVDECGFGYRSSRFKHDPTRHVVLSVTFRLRREDQSAPMTYAELTRRLGIEPGERAGTAEVRQAVLELRSRKGMVLDADDPDTWSAGSFFTNPVLDAEVAARLPDGVPRWPLPDGRVKSSAAWLIEHSGFGKGYGTGRVGVSTKHTLALTNRGGGTARELVALAAEIQEGVHEKFGIWLVNEPVLIGCRLPQP